MFEKVLACPSLPTFPTIAVQLLEITRDPDVSIHDIAQLIRGDQGLASRILRTVNSSFYGLSKPCSTIERAMGFLGIKAIKSLVLGFSVVRMTQGVASDSHFDMSAYWRRTICAAAGARHVAIVTGACDPDEAFTAGLFQDMGMLACYTTISREYIPVLTRAANDHTKLPDIEQAALGFTHAQIGAELAKKWRISEAVIQCVQHHHAPEQADPAHRDMAKTVALGRLCAEAITSEHPAQPMADLMVRANEWFGKNHSDVEQLLNGITTASKELADALDKNIGELPDAQQLLARANEMLAEQQILAQRETEQLQEQAQSLQMQTLTDTLTGAANRKKFDQESLLAFERARTQKKPLSLLFVDADHFKSVNDTHGHQAGDAVLVELAARMMQWVDKLGTVCRYGGEEFAIILPDVPLLKAAQFADLLRKKIAQQPFDLSDVPGAPTTLPVQVSIGVAGTDPDDPEDGDRHANVDQLIQEADKAVYAAKNNGRNCVRVFGGRREGEADAQWAWPEKPSKDKPDVPSTRVLIVEPDALAARLLLDHFSRHKGVQVSWAATYADATEAIQQSQKDAQSLLDLIVCELNLPDGDGTEIIQTAKHNGPVRVVTVTTKMPADRSAAALSAGADEVFFKDDIASKLPTWTRQALDATRTSQSAA